MYTWLSYTLILFKPKMLIDCLELLFELNRAISATFVFKLDNSPWVDGQRHWKCIVGQRCISICHPSLFWNWLILLSWQSWRWHRLIINSVLLNWLEWIKSRLGPVYFYFTAQLYLGRFCIEFYRQKLVLELRLGWSRTEQLLRRLFFITEHFLVSISWSCRAGYLLEILWIWLVRHQAVRLTQHLSFNLWPLWSI